MLILNLIIFIALAFANVLTAQVPITARDNQCLETLNSENLFANLSFSNIDFRHTSGAKVSHNEIKYQLLPIFRKIQESFLAIALNSTTLKTVTDDIYALLKKNVRLPPGGKSHFVSQTFVSFTTGEFLQNFVSVKCAISGKRFNVEVRIHLHRQTKKLLNGRRTALEYQTGTKYSRKVHANLNALVLRHSIALLLYELSQLKSEQISYTAKDGRVQPIDWNVYPTVLNPDGTLMAKTSDLTRLYSRMKPGMLFDLLLIGDPLMDRSFFHPTSVLSYFADANSEKFSLEDKVRMNVASFESIFLELGSAYELKSGPDRTEILRSVLFINGVSARDVLLHLIQANVTQAIIYTNDYVCGSSIAALELMFPNGFPCYSDDTLYKNLFDYIIGLGKILHFFPARYLMPPLLRSGNDFRKKGLFSYVVFVLKEWWRLLKRGVALSNSDVARFVGAREKAFETKLSDYVTLLKVTRAFRQLAPMSSDWKFDFEYLLIKIEAWPFFALLKEKERLKDMKSILQLRENAVYQREQLIHFREQNLYAYELKLKHREEQTRHSFKISRRIPESIEE